MMKWKKKDKSVQKEVIVHKNKKCGTVELYYFNGQPTNSLYRIDNKMIVVSCKSSKEKSVFLPYSIYQNNGEKGLYKVYLEEIETIIKEAEKVEFKEAD